MSAFARPRVAKRLAGSLAAGAVVLTTALASTSLASATSVDRPAAPATHERATAQPVDSRGYYDSRHGQSSTARAIAARRAGQVAERGPVRAFQQALPGRAVFDIDGTTGTVRMLARLDGFLTGKSNEPRQEGRAQVRQAEPHGARPDHRRPQDVQAQA